jgi:hypothetical protein
MQKGYKHQNIIIFRFFISMNAGSAVILLINIAKKFSDARLKVPIDCYI